MTEMSQRKKTGLVL